ncbi:MAG: aquaporin family protein [Chitinophagaceae bacterium]|nr:aquaporin family protein [Chitinophagaceae bacterium]
MHSYLGEFIGTTLLILFGNGVVANVVLKDSKGQNGGWIVIAFGWAMAVFIGVYASVKFGGSGHLNPAVTIALNLFSDFKTELVLPYIMAQFAGAFLGSILVWLSYKQHFDQTEDASLKMACFCTAPAIRNKFYNSITEIIGSFALVFGALAMSNPTTPFVTLNALPVALLVLAIGLSLGGPTGYAINPARDLAPRIAHFLLPIKRKANPDWGYAWVPVIGPILGAVLAAWVFSLIK